MSTPGPANPTAEVRQRWRLVVRRPAGPPGAAPKELVAAWESGLAASGLPVAGLEQPSGRPRIAFGAPLGAGIAAERELMEVFLVERWPVAQVRAALATALPAGHELVDLHDVWLGEPPLTGQVAAADYRITVRAVDGRELDRASLQAASDQLLAAAALPRTRDKGGRPIAYDLRPLVLAATALAVDPDGRAVLSIRTSFDPERGVGRPEEVVAAIGELVGRPLEVAKVVRERLLLRREL
ncbi:MAG: DUF2344 domain-containing protein [Chloroflexi bacterium]|nr:DUF2344 domain-containing protein [Chloroflexota bacterium]